MNEELNGEPKISVVAGHQLPAQLNSNEGAMKLAHVIKEGQDALPQDRPLLVCKPNKIESWRVFKIMSEFVEGFDVIRRYGLAATFFGSARTPVDDPMYKAATELAGKLSKKGFAVITGGSAGIMEAANKGAFEAGGASVGLNIHLHAVQRYNPYLTDKFEFEHFFVRKVMLTYASEVYVYFPGGFGTFDEFFEIVTLVQTSKIRKVPMVLFNKAYWEPLVELMKEKMLPSKKIDDTDLELFRIVDSVDEAFEYIQANVTC